MEDSTDQSVSIVNADPTAAQAEEWQDWPIPLSVFDGLQLDSIRRISIGVSYRDGSQVGSEGILYIDDLRFGTEL